MEIIVGTAGHIDHGKTSLIRALTGTDADRLPEEKQRGITIDIGFAELAVGDTHFGFVDVPGHERFVKNMLAGASGIDLVLLVVAADEGVMPQTREHFEICRLLGLTHGIVVLTKADRVDEETLELARLDVADLVAGSFLAEAPVVAVSSVTGQGIEELKAELVRSAEKVTERDTSRATLLPIDRSFSVKGFGAVITGTLASGEAAEGGELDLFPAGRRVRVRGVQTHGRKVAAAHAGQRTALNLGGIDHSEIERGMVLAEPGTIRPTQIFAADIEMLRDAPRPLRTRQRVRVHIGTAEVLARVFVVNEAGEIAPGDSGLVQLSVETPVIALMGDRFIVRSYSPQMTIAGGSVVLPSIEKLRRRDIPAASGEFRQILAARGDAAQTVRLLIERSSTAGTTFSDLQSATGWKRDVLSDAISENECTGSIARTGERHLAAEVFRKLQEETLTMLAAFHEKEPLAPGLSREAIREKLFRYLPADTFNGVLASLEAGGKTVADREAVRLSSHKAELSPEEKKVSDAIKTLFRDAGVEPPKLDDALARAANGMAAAETRKLFQMILKAGDVVKVTDEMYFAADVIERLKASVRGYADTTPDRVIDVPKFKEIAGVSRKYAIPLLEYFDRERVTVRAGDKRVVLK